MMKTNGVVFQTSATIMAAIAVAGCASHATGECMSPDLIKTALSAPNWSLKIQVQSVAITAVGRVHGARIITRTVLRNDFIDCTDTASSRPITNSAPTEISVNSDVVHMLPANLESTTIRRKLSRPANSA